MPRKGFSRFLTAYTRASTADASRRFFPSETPHLAGAMVKSVRCQADVQAITGDMYLQFAFQESDDPENWPTADTFTVIGATTITTAEGVTGGSSFESITVTKAYVRFGVAARNNNAGSPKYEFAMVSTRFDTRAC